MSLEVKVLCIGFIESSCEVECMKIEILINSREVCVYL